MHPLSLPIEDYRALNEKCGTEPPTECPVPPSVGGLDIRCGPILKLCGTFEAGDNYRATIMIVVKGGEERAPKITYRIGALDGGARASEPAEFPGQQYHREEGYSFWRFEVNLGLADAEQRVQYAINGDERPHFQFFVPAVHESMNVMLYLCNGFLLGVDPATFPSLLWFDVLQNHDRQHYHVMLGGGDQIYSDAIKLHSKGLEQWMAQHNPVKKLHMQVDDVTRAEFAQFYLDNYLQWFGAGFWKSKTGKGLLQLCFALAMAQIPLVNLYDDHDIIDGFGLYRDLTMNQPMFKTVGNVAYKYYMLFQHHMLPEEKAHTADPLWILSKGPGPFIEQKNHSNYVRLGREIALAGIDCRTERKLKEIVKQSTYELIFERLHRELTAAPEVKHLFVMLGVPILYPRLVWLEWLLTLLMLRPVRALAERGVISKGLVNEFDGGVEVLDDLNDHWCSKHHKRERNWLLKNLTEFGARHGVRVTILLGDVHLGCIGRLKLKTHHHPHTHLLKNEDPEELLQHNEDVIKRPHRDPRLVFNVISLAIVNTPPPGAMAQLLNKRLLIHHFNRVTDEDVLPLFFTDTDGLRRDNHQFLNKRNWSDLILAKQSKYAEQAVTSGAEAVWKLPGPVAELAQLILADKPHDERHLRYPLFDDSLVTTMHFENKTDDYDCNSALYEVLIPALDGKYKIDSPGVKHLERH